MLQDHPSRSGKDDSAVDNAQKEGIAYWASLTFFFVHRLLVQVHTMETKEPPIYMIWPWHGIPIWATADANLLSVYADGRPCC